MLGIGVNVAVRVEDLPPELHATAAHAGTGPQRRRAVPRDAARRARARARAAARRSCSTPGARATRSRGREVAWSAGSGMAAGHRRRGPARGRARRTAAARRSTPARSTSDSRGQAASVRLGGLRARRCPLEAAGGSGGPPPRRRVPRLGLLARGAALVASRPSRRRGTASAAARTDDCSSALAGASGFAAGLRRVRLRGPRLRLVRPRPSCCRSPASVRSSSVE